MVLCGREGSPLVLSETQDNEQIIERVAALDIGKAELVCCVRVPHETTAGKSTAGRRLQEIHTYSTMTRSLLLLATGCGSWRSRGW
jgi:transposase